MISKRNSMVVYAVDRSLLLSASILRFVCLFFLSLIIISPMTGTFFTFIQFHWGKAAFFGNVLLAGVMSVYLGRTNILLVENKAESIVLILLTAGSVYLYMQYSPSLYLAQDPSIYLLKAFNLVNYGYCYKPMHIYSGFIAENIIEPMAEYTNGIYYEMPNVYADFFPGSSFFYSLFGMVSKNMIFYAQTAMMTVNAWLLYFAIKKTAGIRHIAAGNYTLMFLAAPVIVWFGRGSFTEPAALVYLLLIINTLNLDRQYPFFLSICFLSSYSSRIDYLLLMLLGVFLISYINDKAGFIYTVAVICEILLYKSTYVYYYGRITTVDMPLLQYDIVLVLIAFAASTILLKWKKELLYSLFYSKAVKYFVAAAGILCFCLIFYNNAVSAEEYRLELIHGKMLRTYQEEILDLLFLVFPSIVLSLGLVGMYKLIDKEKIHFTTSVFIVGAGIVYLYLLFGSSNSPQLYWMLRRYYNNILPICVLAFCCLFRSLKKEPYYLLAAVCMALSLNMYLDSGQIVDFKGLDQSTAKLEQEIKAQGYHTVYFLQRDMRAISPLFTYSDLEFVPVHPQELIYFKQEKDQFDFTNALFLVSDLFVNKTIEDHFWQMELSYLKLGETYGEIPKEVYEKSVSLLGCSMNKLLSSKGKPIYPLLVEKAKGIDGDWTLAEAEISFSQMDVSSDSELVFELYEYDHKYIDQKDIDGLQLQVIVNGKYLLEMTSYKDYKFKFSLNNVKRAGEEMNHIKITCNTFCPADVGKNDARNLGIAVKEIYVQ